LLDLPPLLHAPRHFVEGLIDAIDVALKFVKIVTQHQEFQRGPHLSEQQERQNFRVIFIALYSEPIRTGPLMYQPEHSHSTNHWLQAARFIENTTDQAFDATVEVAFANDVHGQLRSLKFAERLRLQR
jgi:hypothetical protein